MARPRLSTTTVTRRDHLADVLFFDGRFSARANKGSATISVFFPRAWERAIALAARQRLVDHVARTDPNTSVGDLTCGNVVIIRIVETR